MVIEDLNKLPDSSNLGDGSENQNFHELGSEAIKSDSLPLNSEVIDEINEEAAGTVSNDEDVDMSISSGSEETVDPNTPVAPAGFAKPDSVVVDKITSISSVYAENGSLLAQGETSLSEPKKDTNLSCEKEIVASSLCGVKRPRMSIEEQQSSVHVIYSSLPRESKQKLEELLQMWSHWHSQKCSSSDDSELESGEETFFPALRLGSDKPSALKSTTPSINPENDTSLFVTLEESRKWTEQLLAFWVDNQKKVQSTKEYTPLDGSIVPLYDRGYSLALTSGDASISLDGGLEKLDTSRCFNCGSYSHALKDCLKPRDTVAVNNARREHRSKRNQSTNSRNSTRYYQSSRGGKYDGLTPGALDAETRRALGLGELDPPPWLHRMREMGYPPGYLDADVEDQPSGITIFGEETVKEEGEEGEILDASHVNPEPDASRKKMTVEFPGINAPIPENADGWLWGPSPTTSSLSGYRSHRSRHSNYHSYESIGREHHHQTERRWSRDGEDDGPPGCDPGTSPSLSNHFSRYGDHESGYNSPRSSPWSPPPYGRSFSDRSRRSPRRVHDNFPSSSPR